MMNNNSELAPDLRNETQSLDENSGSIFGESSSAHMSQSRIPQEMMTVSGFTQNSSTSTLQTSGHIMSQGPKFIPNHALETTNSPQITNQNQPMKQQVFEHLPHQQTPTYSSMAQSSIGHQNSNHRMPSHLIRGQVSSIQTRQLQNQQPLMRQQSNAGQLQQRQPYMAQSFQSFFQNQTHVLIPEFGRHRPQGLVIGEGHKRAQEQTQGSVSAALSAPVGFKSTNEFPSSEMWREYAFGQILQLKEKYLSELLKIHRKAVQLRIQETNMEAAKKYENAKECLEKIISFLCIPRVDMIPNNDGRVYNYMNFIVNFLTSFRNMDSGSSQSFDQFNQLPNSQSDGPHLQPSGDMQLQHMPPPKP